MVQTEAQYQFVYLAVQQYIQTVSQRIIAEQVSLNVGIAEELELPTGHGSRSEGDSGTMNDEAYSLPKSE